MVHARDDGIMSRAFLEWGMGFFPFPVQISFPWYHPNSSRGNLDFPFPSKQFPWKCMISRGFQFPCGRKLPYKYRFPFYRVNLNNC